MKPDDAALTDKPRELLAVVLPVFNEAENIGPCLRQLYAALREMPHELLVCYDFDGDTTLPAIAAMPDRPPTVKLVKNTLGRGVAHALHAGMLAALADGADVIVTSMADLSDPPGAIRAMAEKIRREGADVVAGSRYMKGGSQSGGPWLKRTLSRAAGLSLYWVAGLGTHDATTNFRAYSAAFLRANRVRSRHGFEVALELTTKAQRQGWKVDEVPSSWQDRSTGQSRFRLWKWLPQYLYWYFAAMAAPLLVGAALVVGVAGLVAYVHAYSTDLIFFDEWSLLPYVTGERPVTPAWLLAPHNEHRIPLPKLVYLALNAAAGHNFHAGPYGNVALQTLTTLLLLGAAQRLRGRWSYFDVLWPVVFLSPGHFETMLSGFCVQLVLSQLLLTVVLVRVARAGAMLGGRDGVVVAGGMLGLLGCGVPGVVLAPPLAAYLLYQAWCWRQAGRGSWPAGALAVWAVGMVVLAGALAWGVNRGAPAYAGPGQTLVRAAQCLGTTFGAPWDANRTWPWMTVPCAALYAATAGLLVWGAMRRPEKRAAALGLLACLLGIGLEVLAVGYGRGASTPDSAMVPRYMALTSPLVAGVFLTVLVLRPRGWGWVLPAVMLVLALALVPQNVRWARLWGAQLRSVRDDVVALLRHGVPVEGIRTRYGAVLFLDEPGRSTAAALEMMQRHRLGIFAGDLRIPAAPRAFDEIDVPVRPVREHWMKEDAGVFRGWGDDPFLEFDLDRTRDVAGVRLEFAVKGEGPGQTLFQFFWMKLPGRDFDYARSATEYLDAGDHTLTFWVYDRINHVRIDPDVRPVAFCLRKITLLVAREGPQGPASNR